MPRALVEVRVSRSTAQAPAKEANPEDDEELVPESKQSRTRSESIREREHVTFDELEKHKVLQNEVSSISFKQEVEVTARVEANDRDVRPTGFAYHTQKELDEKLLEQKRGGGEIFRRYTSEHRVDPPMGA